MRAKDQLHAGDALLIVDAQIDFFPGGALPVPQGDQILSTVNEWIEAALEKNIPIFASRDWHPINHSSFTEFGGPFASHCIQNSKGASIHPDVKLPTNATIINKGENPEYEEFSAFQGKTDAGVSLDKTMQQLGIKRIFMVGLTLEYCVCESALDARNFDYEVHIVLQGTRAIENNAGEAALKKMHRAGVIIEK